ncbi:MAG TPA: hypothetical protein VFV52_12045, partial [Bacilli bacterium]|nr:hypothetical protein [Bacilli bacterium]
MLKSWTDTPQKRFRKAKTFQIHYGWIGEQELLALSGYDLLILEPRQITKEQVEFLQAKMASGARGSVAKRGSDLFERLNGMRDDNGASGLKAAVVFGYLSIMETPTWNQERLTQMESTFYYRDASGDRVH